MPSHAAAFGGNGGPPPTGKTLNVDHSHAPYAAFSIYHLCQMYQSQCKARTARYSPRTGTPTCSATSVATWSTGSAPGCCGRSEVLLFIMMVEVENAREKKDRPASAGPDRTLFQRGEEEVNKRHNGVSIHFGETCRPPGTAALVDVRRPSRSTSFLCTAMFSHELDQTVWCSAFPPVP